MRTKITTLATILCLGLLFIGCSKKEESNLTYNNDLGGTLWVWEGTVDRVRKLKFMDNKLVKCTSIYFGMSVDNTHVYNYIDKNKKGSIYNYSDSNNNEFSISGNVLELNGMRFYKQ